MNRIRFSQHASIVLLAWLTLVAPAGVQAAAPPLTRPNILLIFADDIGYEALGSYGGQDFATPQLDRMAEQGLRFTRAYTSPVCTPSRVSLHTSLHTRSHGHTSVLPVHLGTNKKVDFTRLTSFAQLMRARGYATSTTGKWQLATLEAHPDHLIEAGFDSWCIWQIWRDGAKTLRHWNPTLNQDGTVRDDVADRFGPDVLTEYVIEQMTTARDAGQPFLIVHNELLPHDPIIQTPDDVAAAQSASLGNMIHYMDKLVGQLLDAVDNLGIRNNTYVFFMGDNGTEANYFPVRHTLRGEVSGGKRDLTDAGTHVALLAWGPEKIPVGKTCNDLVDVTDLFPTFCALSDTPIPASVPYVGRSIVPQLHGRPGLPRHWTHQGYGSGESIFDGSWRLARNGSLTDSRALPAEQPADATEPEGQAARTRLQPIFDSLANDGALPESGIIVDNSDTNRVTLVGEWKSSSVTAGSYGADYIHDLNVDKGAKSASYQLPIATNGVHQVYLRWTALANRASNAPVIVTDTIGAHPLTLDQRSDGGKWNLLGSYSFTTNGPAALRIETSNTDGYVIADAVRITRDGQTNAQTKAQSDWRLQTFGAAATNDPNREQTFWGDEADPDGDREVNRLEYARGTHALLADAQTPTHYVESQDGEAFVRTILRTNDTSLLVVPKIRTDLALEPWADIDTTFILMQRAPLSTAFEERRYHVRPGTPNPERLYLTLKTEPLVPAVP